MVERVAQGGLWLTALVVAGFGVVFTAAPELMFSQVDLPIASPVARTELRAVYGGFELGLAAYLAVCASRREWTLAGLVAGGFVFWGLALVRIAGMVVDDTMASPIMWSLLAPELLGAVTTTGLAVALRRSTGG